MATKMQYDWISRQSLIGSLLTFLNYGCPWEVEKRGFGAGESREGIPYFIISEN